METLLLNGEAGNVASLQPQKYEISLVCNFPKAPLEAKYFNIETETFPRR